MTDSGNDSRNQPNQWSPEDWRLLVITFVGGLASIIVGAGLLGLAVALARIYQPHNDFFTWYILVGCPVVGTLSVVYGYSKLKKSLFISILLYAIGLAVIFVLLIWIGIAAGIK